MQNPNRFFVARLSANAFALCDTTNPDTFPAGRFECIGQGETEANAKLAASATMLDRLANARNALVIADKHLADLKQAELDAVNESGEFARWCTLESATNA